MKWFGKKKVGIALGGGVARGIAHIGVLKVLKHHKVPIDCIAAVSSGSVIGSLFAFGLSPDYLEDLALRKKTFDLFRVSMSQINPFAEDEIVSLIEKEIGKATFKEADIPLVVVAQDIKTGERVLLKSGRVGRAVSASCAFPGIFNPKKISGRTLVDGGGADNLPVSVLEGMGADITIAVDVLPFRPLKKDPSNPVQIIGRAIDLVIKELTAKQRELADILIEPDIPPEIWHTDFNKAAVLIKIGEQAAKKKLEEIRRRI